MEILSRPLHPPSLSFARRTLCSPAAGHQEPETVPPAPESRAGATATDKRRPQC